MARLKAIVFAACVVVAIVVALQNTESVETRLLFVTVTMPRVLLLLVTLLVGLAMGVLLGSRLGGGNKTEGESA